MNIYDQAHALASALKHTDEYIEYKRLKALAHEDDTNKALLNECKRLQFQMQARVASGERVDEQDYQKLQRITQILQLNEDARNFIIAEYRFQKLLSDIYRILGEAAGIDLDALMRA